MARAIIAAFIALIWSTAALADSWMPPTVQTFTSANSRFRLTVTPRAISTPLAFFEDKVAKREPAGQVPAGPKTASGLLEEHLQDGRWRIVWNVALHNEVSPVFALVADNGGHVVTFDNWHSTGWGDDAIAIYGSDGHLVRALALTDFLSKDFFDALPRSVSSIWWRRDAHFTTDQSVIVDIISPSPDRSLSQDDDKVAVVPVTLDLTTGNVTPPSGPAWEAALVGVQQVTAERLAWEEKQRQPIAAPDTDREEDWHHYIMEAFFRLDANWQEDFPATEVLRRPSAPDYAVSFKWLRDAVTGKDFPPDVIAIASPDPANLAQSLTTIARRLKPRQLAEARLYIALPPALWPQVEAALQPSGAKLILLDPARPIPQRPERIAPDEGKP